ADRAIVGGIDSRLRVVLPPQRVGLRRSAFRENRLGQNELAGRIARQTPRETLAREMGQAAERVADPQIARGIQRRARHPAEAAARGIRALLIQLHASVALNLELV